MMEYNIINSHKIHSFCSMEKKDLSEANAKRTVGVDLTDELLASTWIKIKDDNDPTVFVLVTFQNSKVTFLNAGISVDEMISSLNDREVYFGVIRVRIDSQVKFFTYYICGASVNGMKKGKASMAKSCILNYFDISHGELSFNEGIESLTRTSMLEQIRSISRQDCVVLP